MIFALLQGQLPDTMPALFCSAYTPIAAAGTQAQIKHVAHLLAQQLTSAGLGPGATTAKPPKPVPVCMTIIVNLWSISSILFKIMFPRWVSWWAYNGKAHFQKGRLT